MARKYRFSSPARWQESSDINPSRAGTHFVDHMEVYVELVCPDNLTQVILIRMNEEATTLTTTHEQC